MSVMLAAALMRLRETIGRASGAVSLWVPGRKVIWRRRPPSLGRMKVLRASRFEFMQKMTRRSPTVRTVLPFGMMAW